MTNCILLIVSFGISGAFWRAAFVAILALIAFLLARYWKSLSAQTERTRNLLIGLRGLSMLLLAMALAGVTVEYESQSRARLLIYRVSAHETRDGAKEQNETRAIAQIVASLKSPNVEIVEQSEVNEPSDSNPDYHSPATAILVTDGAMSAADAQLEIEKISAASGGIPVFIVTDFRENDSPRVAISSVTVMNRPARGVPLQVRCVVHASGMRGRSTLLTISDDAEVRVSAEARWNGDDEWQVLSLEVVPKNGGWVNYLVRAEPAGNEDTATLSRPFTIFAEERRQRILILEGEPTWETKFIRRALDKADLFDVEYFAQVSRSAMVGARDERAGANEGATRTSQQAERGTPGARLRETLSSAARLNAFDCIIVGTTPDALLSQAEATRLREWVERRGGGLIVLGGNNFAGSIIAPKGKLASLMPAEIDSGGFRSDSQTIARSAPVEAEKSRGRFALTPTEAGKAGALRAYALAMEGYAGDGALSGDGLRLGALRPGATVLAVRGQAGAQENKDDGRPLIASMRYGAGRALVFAPSDSWRMRTTQNEDQTEADGPFASLWQGLALWATSGAHPPVEIVMSDASPAAGSASTAEIRVRDEAYVPLAIEKLSARLQQVSDSEDETSQNSLSSSEISFAPDPFDSSIWRAKFIAPPIGRFDLQIKYKVKGKNGSVEKYFATVAPSAIEIGASRDTLQRVARETGGDLFAASGLNSLNDKLAALPQTNHKMVHKLELRSWWPLALFIPLLLSCEWLLERIKSKGERRRVKGES